MFAPYQFQMKNLVSNDKKSYRPLDAEERECLMGFPVGYTAHIPRPIRETTEGKDARISMVGNSWAVPAATWLLSQLGHAVGLASPALTPTECLGPPFPVVDRSPGSKGAEVTQPEPS